MEMPAHLEQAIAGQVARRLEAELGRRGLLLGGGELAEAGAEAGREGGRLAASVLARCYPIGPDAGAIEFESDRAAARLAAALSFGAVTARVLAPGVVREPEAVELCAVFNLGIGLVDSVCDGAPSIGGALLDLLREVDLVEAADEPRARGWLRARTPPPLARDETAAFTVDVVETFFELLHVLRPGAAWSQYRRAIGARLERALEAERDSVGGAAAGTAPARLVECSRLTSVLPFELIERLATGGDATAEPSAGTLLGEAMWRIDDLVDLGQDARSGALNAILLAATDVESVLDSAQLADAAAEAAESLEAGLRAAAADGRAVRSFLAFVQRYAGLGPARPS